MTDVLAEVRDEAAVDARVEAFVDFHLVNKLSEAFWTQHQQLNDWAEKSDKIDAKPAEAHRNELVTAEAAHNTKGGPSPHFAGIH